jgi:hypothetical protein
VSKSLTQRDLLLAAALVVVAVVSFSSLRSHRATSSILADPARTPGVLNPDVTQANIRSTICRHGWTATIRPPTEYTNDLKRKQMRLYGETGSLSDYQEDQPVAQIAGCVRVGAARVLARLGGAGDAQRESRLVLDCCHGVATELEAEAPTLTESQLALAALASLCAGERDAVGVLRRLLRRVRPSVVPHAL